MHETHTLLFYMNYLWNISGYIYTGILIYHTNCYDIDLMLLMRCSHT